MKNTKLRFRKTAPLLLLLIFVVMAPLFPKAEPAATATCIVIFHANDIHGKIDNFAKVAWIIDQERKKNPNVFYFIAGDNFTGNPIIDQYDPPGEPMLQLLNRLQLDLLCPGNHEFDFGRDNLQKFAARALFALVSANIQAAPGAFPQLKPYVILETKNRIKLAVFGLIQIEKESGLPSTHPDKVVGLTFSDPLEKAREFKKLKDGNQILIALTHIGYDDDLLLAGQMPELDVIIGGHSHTRVQPAETVNGVLIAQAGSDNKFLGRVELLVQDGRVIEKKGELIDLNGPLAEDAQVKAMINKFNQNPAFARIIATAPFIIGGKDALGSLMTDALRKIHGLDIAFQNEGGIRVNYLPKKITVKDIYTLDPFGNQIVQIAMSADEIRGLIQNSFARQGSLDLQVSGIRYTVRTDRQNLVKEVVLAYEDGTPLPAGKLFKVGISSYVASAYHFAHCDPGHSLQTTTAETLIRYLESGADLSVYRDLKRAFWETVPDTPRP
jgi:2',3'-cyclic-nucleotide 2'-phosphodiesterase (5'-nucleotidase family)